MKRQFQRGKYFCWEIYLNNNFNFFKFIFDINILNKKNNFYKSIFQMEKNGIKSTESKIPNLIVIK